MLHSPATAECASDVLHHGRLDSAMLSLLLLLVLRLVLAMPHPCRMRAAAAAAAALPVPPLGGGVGCCRLLLLLLEVWLLPLRCCLRLPTGRSVVVADSLPPPKGARRGGAWHWPLHTASCALVLALLLLVLAVLLLLVLTVLLLLLLSVCCDRPRGSLHTTCNHPTASCSPLLRPVRSCRCHPCCACRCAATPEGLQVGCRGCCGGGCLPTHALVLVGGWLGACSAITMTCFSG